MKCQQPKDAISAYVDGQLKVDERSQLTVHLPECPECLAAWKEMEQGKCALMQESESMPAHLRSRIQDMIEEETAPSVPWVESLRRILWQPRWALAGAACAALLALGIYTMRPEPEAISLNRLLSEHMRASRKSVQMARGHLAATPYESHTEAGVQ